jgi:hypothetical protein
LPVEKIFAVMKFVKLSQNLRKYALNVRSVTLGYAHISIFLIIFGYVKNSQVTHRSYALSFFCVSLSLRESSELRGVRLLKLIFMKNLEWNPLNFKELTRNLRMIIMFICR